MKKRKNEEKTGTITLLYGTDHVVTRVYGSARHRSEIMNTWHKVYDLTKFKAHIHILPNIKNEEA